ncbi:MAG: hypothetical protein NWE92_04105 [Candidatus Bathyarchaeota archaeon]|nr:hypothetical protein [Candidatus Bathyarchaeota archaeon]
MYKCQYCSSKMESKGEITEDGSIVFYQCPKCKNVELHAPENATGLRLTYP